jgi:hypothetical protein
MEPKRSKFTINAAVVAAMITFCGTLGAALLGSPVVAEFVNRSNQAQTSAPTSAPTIGMAPTLTQEPSATSAEATSTPAAPTSTPERPTSTPLPLPDLVTLDISSPACLTVRQGTTTIKYVKQDITIRNIGPGETSPFGPFSNRINIIVSGQRYTLDEWEQLFNGLVETPQLDIANLRPNDDATLSLSLNLHGNTKYTLEVVANSGQTVIPETDTTNNARKREFTSNCR